LQRIFSGGDFYEVFDFSQDPNYYPSLPSLGIYLIAGFMMTLVAEAVTQSSVEADLI
jgi:hypothetical protein